MAGGLCVCISTGGEEGPPIWHRVPQPGPHLRPPQTTQVPHPLSCLWSTPLFPSHLTPPLVSVTLLLSSFILFSPPQIGRAHV